MPDGFAEEKSWDRKSGGRKWERRRSKENHIWGWSGNGNSRWMEKQGANQGHSAASRARVRRGSISVDENS